MKSPRRGFAFVAAGLALLAAFAYAMSGQGAAQPRYGVATADPGGDVRLDAALFDDGQARFYRYATADGRELTFFVLKSADGVIRAAFDTCDVGYRERKGYRQAGDMMVCNNCGKSFRSVDVNVLQGGCNPVLCHRGHREQRLRTGLMSPSRPANASYRHGAGRERSDE